ncbi:GntR family transcriptional regulator [Paracoccus alkanivorans]|nr:GntR family transcriptional regulator [Paracoccus alkanivorans]
MTLQKLKRPVSLYDMALEGIRSSIIDGTIEIGEQISETRISEQLGISKTPVREALQELRREGLVQIDPRKRTTVFKPDSQQLSELFDMRILLETGAAERLYERNREQSVLRMRAVVEQMRRAVEHEDYKGYRSLDSDFHQTIIDGAGNSLISETYRPLSFKINVLRNRGLLDPYVVHKSFAFHQRLLGLLESAEAEEFRAALTTHIQNSQKDYEAWLATLSPPGS